MTRRHVREQFLELRLKRSKDLGNPPLEFVKLVHDDCLIFKRYEEARFDLHMHVAWVRPALCSKYGPGLIRRNVEDRRSK